MADGFPAGFVHAHGEGVFLYGIPPVADVVIKISCHRRGAPFRKRPVGFHGPFRGGRCGDNYAIKIEGGVLEEF